jgi:chemotaxis protein methyltransferase CheR
MEKIKDHHSEKEKKVFVSRATTLSEEEFKKLSTYIETELGIKMPPAKKIMLESRLQKRIRALKLNNFDDYLEMVFGEEETEAELVHMIDAVTTNKTDFFREPDHFEYLSEVLLPDRYTRDGWGTQSGVKVWSTASSSGEEPYTIAMILEDFRQRVDKFRYAVLGTDISSDMLDRGRNAVYTEERVAPIPQNLKKRFLLRNKDKTSKLYRVRPEIRKRVLFHRLNLMSDKFGIDEKFEIIFCRNVIIYFDRPNQAKLLRKLYNYLIPGGYLFLGHSETLAGMELPLYSVAPTIYRKPE